MITYETILHNPRAMIGIIGLAIMLLVLFIWDRKENRKNYKHRVEFGSARWGNKKDITMAIFDVAKWVITQSGGIIAASTAVDASALASFQAILEGMETGELFSIFMQTFALQFLIKLAAVFIFIVVNGRMIEIYLYISMAPIPFATFGNAEQSQMGQNYFKALWALGLQGFLIMVCVGIYAVMIQSVVFSADIMGSMWKVFGFTVLLGFTLLKSGTIAKAILHAT